MADSSSGEQAARIAVLVLAVTAFNQFRRGGAEQLRSWAGAKFFNSAAPKSDGPAVPGGALGEAFGAEVGNLRSDPAGLVAVGNTRMSARFAARWVPLAAAARADGIVLTGGAYRSAEQQIALRKAHCGSSQYDIYERPASQCSPPTARPGTSNHETGDAIDVDNCSTRNRPEFVWLSRNAARFGVYNLPSEPWHWSIDGK